MAPRQAVIVAGVRTPFARAGSVFKDTNAVTMARFATRELLARSGMEGREVDEVIFGQVIQSVMAPNVAREVSLLPQFPKTIPAYSLNRACASAGQAISAAHDQIVLGHADVVVAGGVESLSDIPILHSRRMSQLLVAASRAKSLGERIGIFAKVRPRDLVPVSPAISEPSTGESMGQSAEKMAKENRISRDAQDRFALMSHQRAAAATADGRLAAEIAPWFGGKTMSEVVTTDNGIRADSTLQALAALRPVFDRRYGSVTAGNASPLTDGAAATLIMAKDKALALGMKPLATIRSYAVAAVDPGWQLLMGPVFAVPKALDRAGITLAEVGVVEIHEAFAAQVLSNVEAWASKAWADRLGRSAPVGEIDWERTNVSGGSIAIGHPFGATGARIVTTLANEMERRDVQFGLVSICAQGGMGFAMVLERSLTMPLLTTQTTESGVAVVSIDVPGEPVNSLSMAHSDELAQTLDRLKADSSVRGVVLRSGKPDTFIAGADINQFVAFRSAADAEAASRNGHAFLERIETFPKPIVVAIHGACLGLGLELSLACSYRVASDHSKTQLGLPEVQLGLLPGAGGCYRLPRLIGARAALDIILAGKSERAAKAFKLGLVDELVPESIVVETAVAAALRLAASGPFRRRPVAGLQAALLDRTPLGRRLVYRTAKAQVVKKTGGHYPAPLRALEVVRIGLEQGKAAGLAAEAKAFGELAVTSVSRHLVQIFFATTALKKDDGVPPGTATPRDVTRLAVVGSGFMGAGIAGTAVTTAKVEVRLKDADLGRVGKGIRAALDIVQGQLTRRKVTKFEFERLAALVSGGTDFGGFGRADLVIEAVFEDLAVKRQVLAECQEILPSTAVFASNTSTIPIARIADGALHPENVVGMHFFSPVDRMPLLEIIPAARTSPDTIATAVRFGRKLGKTVIVVADRPGFWVNRILSPYFVEAGHLVVEGVPIEVIDRTMVQFGMPVGPIALLDEVGIDVAAKGGVVMREAFGDRLVPVEAIGKMVEAKRLGRKAGSGFYLYHDGHKTDPDPEVYRMFGIKPLAAADAEQVRRRLVYALLNEAARAAAEGVVRSPRDGDIGAIFGIGFPPFLGGPLRLIDSLGAAAVVATLEELVQAHGPRFAPAEALVEMARDGRTFYPAA